MSDNARGKASSKYFPSLFRQEPFRPWWRKVVEQRETSPEWLKLDEAIRQKAFANQLHLAVREHPEADAAADAVLLRKSNGEFEVSGEINWHD